MTPDRIHELSLIQILDYRTRLNAAAAGYPSHTAREVVTRNSQMLSAWEEIDRIRDWTALTTEQRSLLNEAAGPRV